MSSLAAARADNFYFPPDYRPEYGGLSKFNDPKFKGANQYQQSGIVRFELPFDGWCVKCHRHISKGTRYNAKKEEHGKYFTTKIWAFHMKCASCDQHFVIKTDPAHDTYDFAEGIRKMEQEFDPDFDDSIIKATTNDERALLASNPIFRLQHDVEDKTKAASLHQRIAAIESLRDEQYLDDYTANSTLRSKLRKIKKIDKSRLEDGKKIGLNIPLIDTSSEDVSMAKLAIHKSAVTKLRDNFSLNEKLKFHQLQSKSIFSLSNSKNKTTVPKTSSSSNYQGSATPGQTGRLAAAHESPTASRQSKEAREIFRAQAAATTKLKRKIDPRRFVLCSEHNSQTLSHDRINQAKLCVKTPSPNNAALTPNINDSSTQSEGLARAASVRALPINIKRRRTVQSGEAKMCVNNGSSKPSSDSCCENPCADIGTSSLTSMLVGYGSEEDR